IPDAGLVDTQPRPTVRPAAPPAVPAPAPRNPFLPLPDPAAMPPEKQVAQPQPPVPQQAPPVEPVPFREPYRSAAPRGFSDWGQDWRPLKRAELYPGTEMPPGFPTSREAVGIIRSAGGQLAQWGAPGVAQPAFQASGLAGMLRSNPMIAMGLDIASKGAF